ncbi:hypothetical protein COBT_002466 [Conglomerata obtusa]
MMLKLTNIARSWGSLIFEFQLQITLVKFIIRLKQRFTNETKSQEILEKFIAAQFFNNKEEYRQSLKAANNINDTCLLKTSALIKIVITKSPTNLRALFFQVAGNEYDKQAFFNVTNESNWIASPTLSKFPSIEIQLNIKREPRR